MNVSVIIPIRNSSGFISKAVSSIADNNDMTSTEIILVDDVSDDIDLIKSLYGNVSYVKIIEKDVKTNAADSRNLGIENAIGEYLFFLDSDDYFMPGFITLRIEHMNKFKSGITFGPYYDEVESGGFIIHKDRYSSQNNMREFLFVKNGDFRSSTISIHRKNYKGTIFDYMQNKHQDWGFAIRCFDNHESITYDENNPNVCLCKNLHSQMSSSMNISASKYFISKYLPSDKYISGFIKRHFIMCMLLKDKKAISFFKSLPQYSIYIKSNKKNKIAHFFSFLNVNISSFIIRFFSRVRGYRS